MVIAFVVYFLTGACHAPVDKQTSRKCYMVQAEADQLAGRDSPAGRKGTFDRRRLSKVLLRLLLTKVTKLAVSGGSFLILP